MKGFTAATALLAAALSGCGGVPYEYTKHGEMSDKPGLLGELTWRGTTPARTTPASASPAAPSSAAEQAEFKKWQESAGSTERKEFEDWRAWQEWRRQNPK